MSNPYRLTEEGRPSPSSRGTVRGSSGAGLRVVLWTLLVISVAGNSVTSLGGMNMWVSATFGVVTVACIVALVVHHMRTRR